ncbi:MAG: exodeoxyribonuclease VII large subunit [Tenuifilaceae bacterium]
MSNGSTRLTLLELNLLVKETLAKSLAGSYWVVGEISEITEHPSGHCYMELVQKGDDTDTIRAKARANIWGYTYRMLKPYFESTTNRPLSRGMKILVNAQVVFHEYYGYSLTILDIEPEYTLGDIELKRREVIARLISDGVMNMNKELELDMLPQRVAVISSANAAGFQDFVKQLTHNPHGYAFTYELFPALMQGDEAELSIINALGKIYDKLACFDLVTIVRGGGAQTDLSCFDSYALASNIAQFPIPVITGIGHDRDVTVADMVSHTSLKTPTAVAEFLIDKFRDAEAVANNLAGSVSQLAGKLLADMKESLTSNQVELQAILNQKVAQNKLYIQQLTSSLPHMAKLVQVLHADELKSLNIRLSIPISRIKANYVKLNAYAGLLKSMPHKLLQNEKIKIEHHFSTLKNLHPDSILHRGFTITYSNGKIVKNLNNLNVNDVITTQFWNGSIESNITKIKASKKLLLNNKK